MNPNQNEQREVSYKKAEAITRRHFFGKGGIGLGSIALVAAMIALMWTMVAVFLGINYERSNTSTDKEIIRTGNLQ